MEKIWKEAEKDIIIHNNRINIIESCLDRHAEQQPNKTALVFEDENGKKEYSYKQLNEEASRFANFLDKQKVKKNSRIFIFLPKVPEHYMAFLGAIKHGSIAAPLFEAFQTEGVELRLKRGDADVLVTNNELVKRVKHKNNFKGMKIIVVDSTNYKKQIKEQSADFKTVLKSREDTALLMFTSSTAGTPVAGIQLPHQALIQQHYTAKLVLGLNSEDKYWCTAHPGWVTGSVYGIIAPLSIGCSVYSLGGRIDAEKWLDFLKNNKISVLYTAPTALRMLKSSAEKSDFEFLKNLCSIGEALTQSTFEFYKELGIEINDTYWQTETGAIVIATWPGLKRKKGSIGKAILGINAKIIDETIAIKPKWPSMMTGIYKHEKMYKSYFKNGWFTTNDSAKQDKQGYFYFIGRKDDIIKTRGERISPIEIESALTKHKAVKEAAVIGIPDKIKGTVLKAFVVLQDNASEKEKQKLKEELPLFVKQNYAGHAYPSEIEFIKNLPKTNSGKIIRMKLREKS